MAFPLASDFLSVLWLDDVVDGSVTHRAPVSVSFILHAERLSDTLMTCGVVALTLLVILGSIAIACAGALWIWAFDPVYRLSYRARSSSPHATKGRLIIAPAPADQVLSLPNRTLHGADPRGRQVTGS